MSNYVGVVPAAGEASRLDGLPKFLLPLDRGFLLSRLCDQFLSVVPFNDIDIVANLSTAPFIQGYARSAPIMMNQPTTMSASVLRAREYHSDHGAFARSNVLFAMPDTYIEDGAWARKLQDCIEGGADVAVGVFWTRDNAQRSQMGMVQLDGDYITDVVDKPAFTQLQWGWVVWRGRPNSGIS